MGHKLITNPDFATPIVCICSNIPNNTAFYAHVQIIDNNTIPPHNSTLFFCSNSINTLKLEKNSHMHHNRTTHGSWMLPTVSTAVSMHPINYALDESQHLFLHEMQINLNRSCSELSIVESEGRKPNDCLYSVFSKHRCLLCDELQRQGRRSKRKVRPNFGGKIAHAPLRTIHWGQQKSRDEYNKHLRILVGRTPHSDV